VASGFTRTGALLRADGFRGSALILLVALSLAGGWIWWFSRSEVPLYEVTGNARLETNRAGYVVQSPIDGKLVSSDLMVGRRVAVGDELARVESDLQRLQRTESRTRIGAVDAQIKALESELALSEKAAEDERRTTQSGIEVAQQQLKSAEAPAKYLEAEIERVKRLQSQGLISEREYQRTLSEAAEKRATADSLRATIGRLEREQSQRDSQRQVRHQQIRSEMTRLTGEIQTTRTSMDRLDFEIDRRVIRAPVAGVVGESAVLRPGAFLTAGQKLAAVLPEGGTIMVAQFPPASALGRIQPGQTARIRLQGFPWMQYGSLLGKVDRVAGEVRDGTVRVELAVGPSERGNIPMQHGLPGSVEIEVERISPMRLAMRLAGNWATAPRQGRGSPAP
jgi:membrane fusion protein (multidrug efflux system)